MNTELKTNSKGNMNLMRKEKISDAHFNLIQEFYLQL